jgi:hypothetical protein
MLLTAIVIIVSVPLKPHAIFEIDLWPGEGRPVFAALAVRFQLRETPTKSARVVATWTGRIGQVLTFDDRGYQTTQLGRFIVLNPTIVTGRQWATRNELIAAERATGVRSIASGVARARLT